jgi:glycosyltransferase involved in cell wall biosynthesis
MMRIAIAFLGNIHYDTRSFNLFNSLESKGHDVRFIGYDWETPGFHSLNTPYIRVIQLRKTRFSALFYLRFAVSIYFQLMKNRFDLFIASDFYSLLFCTAAARFRKARLIYDSREITSELPAFHDKPFLKRVVLWVERACIPRASCVLSTGEMDSAVLKEKFGIRKPVLLRNLPRMQKGAPAISFLNRFPTRVRKVLVYQGILVPGRGIETALAVLKKLPEYGLVLLGGGELGSYYHDMVQGSGVAERVLFAGKVPQRELLQHTAGCDVGLSLIDNICDNNYYALPNKLFEYVMAGLPVIVTELPQMKAVVEDYRIGAVVPERNPQAVANVLLKWDKSESEFRALKRHCRKASLDLNWEKEFEKAYSKIMSV